jgi:hypothetical protein
MTPLESRDWKFCRPARDEGEAEERLEDSKPSHSKPSMML